MANQTPYQNEKDLELLSLLSEEEKEEYFKRSDKSLNVRDFFRMKDNPEGVVVDIEYEIVN